MSESSTPILDLDVPPPQKRDGVSLKGLLKATPAALAIVACIPAAIFVQDRLRAYLPYWIDSSPASLSRFFNPLLQMNPVPALLSIWLGMWIALAIHEAGHAVAASIGGWRLLEIRAVPFSLRNRGGIWRLHASRNLWLGGLVLAEPKTTRFHSKLRTYALAGPVANLVTFLIATTMRPLFDNAYVSAELSFISGWALVGTILNILPIHIRNMELDGYVAFVVSRRPKLLATRLASLRIRNHMLAGRSLAEVNRRWVALAEGVGKVTLQNVTGLWLAYAYRLDKDEYERAAQLLEKIIRASGTFNAEAKGVMYSECAVIQSFRKRKTAAEVWADRAQELPQPEYIQYRRKSCLAFNDDDLNRAYLEAELSRDAMMSLNDTATREALLKDWNRWMDEIQEKRTQLEAPDPERQSQTAGF